MEFLPGAFEREWERRRAALVHEMQMGQFDMADWDEPRRGGVARLPDDGLIGFGRVPQRGGGSHEPWARGGAGSGSASRSMATRFVALARGSQPAVVKLASYGGGDRSGAMMSYTARGGDLEVENERGERILGKDALAGQCAEWEHLFDNRTASRDLAIFHVTIDGASLRSDVDSGEQVREILRAGLGNRRFVYAVRERSSEEFAVSGVVVLRDHGGERLTGDKKAAKFIQQRYDESGTGRDVAARFRFHGYGNGVEWGTARARELVARTESDARDNLGRLIEGAEQAGDLVQKEWRKELHSRKGRDVMHLIVSARAGTDALAFRAAAREFLGEQFAGHRYVFAVHDPALDPKEVAEGGRRPHIHAHAIVTMRSETGERIETSPQLFREWRSLMAEKARQQGIEMELTDRREFASAPAYTRNQVRPVSFRGRTEHEGTSEAAHTRYQAKRSNEMALARSNRSKAYVAAAAGVWNDLSKERHDGHVSEFAALQKDRLETAVRYGQIDVIISRHEAGATKNNANMALLGELIEGEVDQMREMTRPEFEAYAKRVEAVLDSVEQTLNAYERVDFDEVASAAREVVDIRREYLEFTEQQANTLNEHWQRDSHGEERENANVQWDAAVARFGAQAVETAHEVLTQVEHYRQGLDRIEAGELPQHYTARYHSGLAREIHRAAEIAVDDGNQYMRDVSKSDQELLRAIELIESSREEAHRTLERRQPERPGTEPDGAGGPHKGSAGGSSVVVEAEQNRGAGHDSRLSTSQYEHTDDRQRSPVPNQPWQRSQEAESQRHPVGDVEAARTDPAQQHVPRLRQIELEIEERDDRDDRER